MNITILIIEIILLALFVIDAFITDTDDKWANIRTGGWIGILIVFIITDMLPDNKTVNQVTDIIYNPKDSSWHLDISTGKDTVEVPVNAQTAAKFIHKTH